MYAGDPNLCRAFLTKCSLFFSLQPLTFATEVSRVALVLTLLSGRAALWGTAVWENRHPLLFLVPLTLSGDEEGVRSRAGRARGSAHAGRPPPGGAVRFWLFHPVQDPGGRVWVEREGAVGHVPAWAGRPYPSRDRRGGVTSRVGRTCGSGLTRGCTASATRSSWSTQVNTEISFLRHRRYGRSLVGWRTHAGG